ncbi:MAG: hypothetical protein ACLP6G_11705 [Terriglobales bacterium]
MGRITSVLALFCLSISAAAQATNANPQNASQQHSKKAKDEITVRGCLSRSNTDYILIQPDQGNSYELERSGKLRLGPYLGQEVEVTGSESPSLSTSSDFLARTGSASAVTIRVTAIKMIQKKCSGN